MNKAPKQQKKTTWTFNQFGVPNGVYFLVISYDHPRSTIHDYRVNAQFFFICFQRNIRNCIPMFQQKKKHPTNQTVNQIDYVSAAVVVSTLYSHNQSSKFSQNREYRRFLFWQCVEDGYILKWQCVRVNQTKKISKNT